MKQLAAHLRICLSFELLCPLRTQSQDVEGMNGDFSLRRFFFAMFAHCIAFVRDDTSLDGLEEASRQLITFVVEVFFLLP